MEHRPLALTCCLQGIGKHTDRRLPDLASSGVNAQGALAPLWGLPFMLTSVHVDPLSSPCQVGMEMGFMPLHVVIKAFPCSQLAQPPPHLSDASLQQLVPLLQDRLPAQPLPGPASFVHWGPGAWKDHFLLSALCYLGGISDRQALFMLTWLHLALHLSIYLLR